MRRTHISIYISRLLISALLLSLPIGAIAKKKTETPVAEDSIPLFRNVAVSFDALGAGQLLFSDYGQYEVAVRVNLRDKFYPVLEVGLGTADASDETTLLSYKTDAPYFRVGCDWNLLKNKHDIYRLYGGLRVAYTSFEYDVEREEPLEDPVWGGTSDYSAEGVKANCLWLEGSFGIDVKLAGPVRMGWSIRYRRRLKHDEGDVGKSWYVPGYGKSGTSRIGGTFNITFEF